MPSLSSPIAKVDSQNCVETASESEEETKREKSLSPMSITSEVISDNVYKNNIRLLQMEVQSKSNEIEKLENDIKKSTEKINKMKENKTLVRKLRKLQEYNNKYKSNFLTAELKSQLKSWEEKRTVKEMETKELWNAIQIQDDANFKLMLDAEDWVEREKNMKNELMLLKKTLNSPDNKEREDVDLYVSYSTFDWKLRLEYDIHLCLTDSDCQSFLRTHNLVAWEEEGMIKSEVWEDFLLAKDCKKSPSECSWDSVAILPDKNCQLIYASRQNNEIACDQWKNNTEPRLESELMSCDYRLS